MKITLLGTGTPTHPRRFQSAVLIEAGSDKLLFDAGRGAVHQMYQAGVKIGEVGPVFITHHHFDHINDLFDVIISSAFNGRKGLLKIYGPRGTKDIVKALLEQVYARDIRFRIEEAREFRRRGGHWNEQPEVIAMVSTSDVGPGLVAQGRRWKVLADHVLHGQFPAAPDFQWHCLGYRIEAEGQVVAISGDAVMSDALVELAKGADLLVQCCHLPYRMAQNGVMKYWTGSILPSSGQVGKIAARAGAKRMVITHLRPEITGDVIDQVLEEIARDYSGPVLVGNDLMEIELP
jgi:ribonuclease Z